MGHGHDNGANPVLNTWAKISLCCLFIVVALFNTLQSLASSGNTLDPAAKICLSVALPASFIAGIIALLRQDSMKEAGTWMIVLVVFANIIFTLPVYILV